MMMPVARFTASQVGQGSRSSYLRSFTDNSVTETRVLYRISNNRITRQPLTFSQKKVKKNLEDTAEKALAQYWDDVERSTLMTTKERVVLASAHFLGTNCSSTADRLHDTLYQTKSCQLLHNCRNKVHNKPIRDRSNAARALRSTDVCVRLATRWPWSTSSTVLKLCWRRAL